MVAYVLRARRTGHDSAVALAGFFHFAMASEHKPTSAPVSLSSQRTSTTSRGKSQTQLSGGNRVELDVSATAMDRGLLMAAMGPQTSANLSHALAGVDASSDAEIMLRVKAGDTVRVLASQPRPKNATKNATSDAS